MQGEPQGDVWSSVGFSSFHQALLPMERQHMGVPGGSGPWNRGICLLLWVGSTRAAGTGERVRKKRQR